MDYRVNDKTLTVCLQGRVDSSNAETLGTELDAIRHANPHEALVLDCGQLEYLSSAGLRLVLRLRKENPSLRLTDVSSEVYEILEMTGFTEMLPVEKAYRRLNVEGCEVIGAGANGTVYRLDTDTIIKVYHDPDSLPDIQRERELARKAFVLGVPTAIPYDVVRVGDGYGSVFELLSAKSLNKRIIADPASVDEYIGPYVELMKKIHATEVKPGELPSKKDELLSYVDFLKEYLPAQTYEKLRRLAEGIPERNTMLHGDYHMKNVMMQNGELLLIDMDTLCMGDPIFEFAGMYLTYMGFGETNPEDIPRFLGITPELASHIWEQSLVRYFENENADFLRCVTDMARLAGYPRIARRFIRRYGFDTPEGAKHIRHYLDQIVTLTEQLESLDLSTL